MTLEDIGKIAELNDLNLTPAEAQQILDELDPNTASAHEINTEEDLRKLIGRLGEAADEVLENS